MACLPGAGGGPTFGSAPSAPGAMRATVLLPCVHPQNELPPEALGFCGKVISKPLLALKSIISGLSAAREPLAFS